MFAMSSIKFKSYLHIKIHFYIVLTPNEQVFILYSWLVSCRTYLIMTYRIMLRKTYEPIQSCRSHDDLIPSILLGINSTANRVCCRFFLIEIIRTRIICYLVWKELILWNIEHLFPNIPTLKYRGIFVSLCLYIPLYINNKTSQRTEVTIEQTLIASFSDILRLSAFSICWR